MDSLETYHWYKQFAKHWTEKRVEPLALTDTEILDFIDEYGEMIQQVPATEIFPRRFVIDIAGIDTVRAGSLREAVCLAAAKFTEVNS